MKIVWRKFMALNAEGMRTAFDPFIPRKSSSILFEQISEMPRDERSPIPYDEAMGKFQEFWLRPETRISTDSWVQWISDQGFYVELKGGEYRLVNEDKIFGSDVFEGECPIEFKASALDGTTLLRTQLLCDSVAVFRILCEKGGPEAEAVIELHPDESFRTFWLYFISAAEHERAAHLVITHAQMMCELGQIDPQYVDAVKVFLEISRFGRAGGDLRECVIDQGRIHLPC